MSTFPKSLRMLRGVRAIMGRFAGDRSASVMIIAAVALPILLGFAALSAEYGYGLLTRAENQRVADGASYAGALAYSASGEEDDMVAAAEAIATLNGLPSGAVSVALAPSPRDASQTVVHVTVLTNNTLFLAPILGVDNLLAVRAESFASIGGEAQPGCILALNAGGTGLTLSGGVSVNAPDCAVSSNNTVTAPCGTFITALQVTYGTGTDINDCQWSVNVRNRNGGPADVVRVETPDPLTGNGAVGSVSSRLTTMANQAALAPLTVPNGQNIDFGWDQTATRNQATAAGCTAAFASSTWTLTCPNGNRNFGTITVGGGISVNFNTGGAASNIYTFSGPILSNAVAMRFGNGTFRMARGIIASGSAQTSFGAGTFQIGGSATTNCESAGRVSICKQGSATVSFAGPSRFQIHAGIAAGGSGTGITLGTGNNNTYQINASSSGFGLWLGGGSRVVFADSTGTDIVYRPEDSVPPFLMHGNLSTGGGSCLTLPAAAQHDIRGNIDAGGGVRMGAGLYNISGYLALGANGGGAVSCDGANISLYAMDVTIMLGGAATATGQCANQVFCATAGYNGMVLVGRTVSSAGRIAIIGPQNSARTGGALWSGGASGSRISGAFYFPFGPIRLDGGAGVSGVQGDCLQLIGTQITLAGGAVAASECITERASSGGTIAWVQ